MCLLPSNCLNWFHKVDSNWQPLSVVTVEGTPNRDIQVLMNIQARNSAGISVSGTASGQWVKQSMQVMM